MTILYLPYFWKGRKPQGQIWDDARETKCTEWRIGMPRSGLAFCLAVKYVAEEQLVEGWLWWESWWRKTKRPTRIIGCLLALESRRRITCCSMVREEAHVNCATSRTWFVPPASFLAAPAFWKRTLVSHNEGERPDDKLPAIFLRNVELVDGRACIPEAASEVWHS